MRTERRTILCMGLSNPDGCSFYPGNSIALEPGFTTQKCPVQADFLKIGLHLIDRFTHTLYNIVTCNYISVFVFFCVIKQIFNCMPLLPRWHIFLVFLNFFLSLNHFLSCYMVSIYLLFVFSVVFSVKSS